jgi:phosphoglucomutase
MLSFTTRTLNCDAGIVITASHNPPNYNGYKVYGPDGGQAVSPLVDKLIAAIKPVDFFEAIKTIDKTEAINRNLFKLIDPALDRAYLEQVKALSLSDPEQCLKVVFTPLHGTGSVYIPNLLTQTRCIELHLVEEQMTPDPDFSTVRVPNPEDPAALDLALKLAGRVDADLILATDPDGDRVGTAVRDQSGRHVILSGNQVGALLIEYICSRHREKGTMPADPVLVKTIVTGDLGRRVAESHGLKIVETLTGFKFIGDQIREFEANGSPHFVFGYEESCGYLTGTFVRDKDAVIASFLIAEMAAYYKDKGLNLIQVLEQIQQRVDYHRDELLTVELDDISEADRHVAAYQQLPHQFAGQVVIEKRDYDLGKGWKVESGEEFPLALPRSPVLHYTLADGSWFAVRPSGTEPKVKFYLSVSAPEAAEADRKLTRLREAVLEKR